MIHPDIEDALKLIIFQNLTKFFADGLSPEDPRLKLHEGGIQAVVARYGAVNQATSLASTLANYLSGHDNPTTQAFERENQTLVAEAKKKLCSCQPLRDWFSWYVDLLASDGRPEGRTRAQEIGLYVASSPGKDLVIKHMGGTGKPIQETPAPGRGKSCLVPLLLLFVAIVTATIGMIRG